MGLPVASRIFDLTAFALKFKFFPETLLRGFIHAQAKDWLFSLI